MLRLNTFIPVRKLLKRLPLVIYGALITHTSRAYLPFISIRDFLEKQPVILFASSSGPR